MLTLNILANTKSREVTQKGYKGEKLTSCNYGGGLRELKFEVCECSVYVDSRIPKPEKIIGFVKHGGTARPRITVIKIA
jgi:hypothetical protein